MENISEGEIKDEEENNEEKYQDELNQNNKDLMNQDNLENNQPEEDEKKDEKKITTNNKINEEIKAKINKFNENKIQEKKPILKPITEQNMNMENRNRTFTVYTPNQNAFENNPFMKKYILIFLFI